MDQNGLFNLPLIRARNDGMKGTSTLSIHMYFSQPIGGSSMPWQWQEVPSDESGYPVAFYWDNPAAFVSSGETWIVPPSVIMGML